MHFLNLQDDIDTDAQSIKYSAKELKKIKH